MTSVNTLNSSSYYQLSDPSAGPGGNGVSSNPTSALVQALNSSSANDQTAGSSSDAYMLDLSPTAQNYLNGLTSNGLTSNGSTSADSLFGSSSESFNLTTQQEQKIASILEQYKNAPYTQATFDSIQNALQAAGLGTQTLSAVDQAQSFNPTQLLVNDLSGNFSAPSSAATPADESEKSANYMQQIIKQWQEMSGNTGAATGTNTNNTSSASSASGSTANPTSATAAS